MNNGGSSFTQTTGLGLGSLISAPLTGAFEGTSLSLKKSSDVLRKSKEAENILKSVQQAIKEYDAMEEAKLPGVETAKESLADEVDLACSVHTTGTVTAKVIQDTASGLGTILSHGTQLVSDLGIASSATVAFTKKNLDSKSIKFNASTLLNDKGEELALLGKDDAKANFFASCKYLCEKLDAKLDGIDKFLADGHHFAESHASIAHGTASTSTASSVGVAAILSCGFDLIGDGLREIQASASDTSKHSEQEAAVYKALTACIESLTETKKSDESALASLNNLNN